MDASLHAERLSGIRLQTRLGKVPLELLSTEAEPDVRVLGAHPLVAVLFLVTLVVNGLARWLVWRVSREARS